MGPLKQMEGGRGGYQYRKTLWDAGSILPLSSMPSCVQCVFACMCVRACVQVCVVCAYAVSCAAFVLKRLHQRERICMFMHACMYVHAHVCVCGLYVRAVYVCVHTCCVFVCELQAAWHMRTDQLVRVTCPTGLQL